MNIRNGKLNYEAAEIEAATAIVLKDKSGYLTGFVRSPFGPRMVAEHAAMSDEQPWSDFVPAALSYRDGDCYTSCIAVPVGQSTAEVLELVEGYIQHRKSDWEGLIIALSEREVKHTIVYNTRAVSKAELEEELGYKLIFTDKE